MSFREAIAAQLSDDQRERFETIFKRFYLSYGYLALAAR